MSKELLEIRTGQFGIREPVDTIYRIAEPQPQRGGEPRVHVFDENETFIEEFISWTHMRAQFMARGWEVVESTFWDDSDTWSGYYHQLAELNEAGCNADTDWGDLLEGQKETVS